MSAIAQVFSYANAEVRTVLIGDEPYFVATDICPLLGYQHTPSAIRRLDDDEYRQVEFSQVSPNVRPDGPPRRPLTAVSEGGLYSLILWSHKPEAKAFKRWITHEVLPAIRKTGRYGGSAALPQSFAEALQLAADQARRIEEQQGQLAAQAPQVDAFNAYLSAAGDLSVADAAKTLSRHPNIDLGQNRLFTKLREQGWIFRPADGGWRIYQRVLDAGWMAERAQSHTHPDTGERVVDVPQVRITPRGLAELHRRLAPGTQLAIATGADRRTT